MDKEKLRIIRSVSSFHFQQLNLNPNHTQKLTAEEFKLSKKNISMILTIYEHLNDEEILKKLGLKGAYEEIMKRRREKNNKTLEKLLKF